MRPLQRTMPSGSIEYVGIASPASPSTVTFLSWSRESALAGTPRGSRRAPGAPSSRLQCRSHDPADALDKGVQRAQIVEESATTALNVLHVPAPPRVSVRPAIEPNPCNEGSRLAACGHRRSATRKRNVICRHSLTSSGNSPVTEKGESGPCSAVHRAGRWIMRGAVT